MRPLFSAKEAGSGTNNGYHSHASAFKENKGAKSDFLVWNATLLSRLISSFHERGIYSQSGM